MELELLKEIWSETGNQPSSIARVSPDALHKAVSSQQKIIALLKRNLLIELGIVFVCVIAIAAFYFTAFNGNFREVSWVYIILAIGFMIYYYHKNKLLKSMQETSLNVKANLQLRLYALEKYIRLYLIAGTVLVPILMTFFYVLLYYKHITVFPLLQSGTDNNYFTLVYIIFSIFFTFVLYFLYRWYIYKLYGKHILQLKAMLNEMEEEI